MTYAVCDIAAVDCSPRDKVHLADVISRAKFPFNNGTKERPFVNGEATCRLGSVGRSVGRLPYWFVDRRRPTSWHIAASPAHRRTIASDDTKIVNARRRPCTSTLYDSSMTSNVMSLMLARNMLNHPLDNSVFAHQQTSPITRGYCGGSPTAVQAWQPCPLWEPSPSHLMLV